MNDTTTQIGINGKFTIKNSCLVVEVELSVGVRTVASSRFHECAALDLVWIRIRSIEPMTRC